MEEFSKNICFMLLEKLVAVICIYRLEECRLNVSRLFRGDLPTCHPRYQMAYPQQVVDIHTRMPCCIYSKYYNNLRQQEQ